MDELFGKLPTWQNRMDSFAVNLNDSITDNFTDIIMQTQSVSDAFRNMALNIISYIAKIYVEQAIARPIASGLVNLIGGGIWGGGSTDSGTVLPASTAYDNIPGLAADGGFIEAGSPTLVGERGKELFIPSVDGTVIPSSQLANSQGGSGGVTVHQSFTLSAGTPQELEAKMRVMIAKAKNEIASSVADVSRRGGKASSMLRNGA